MFSLTVLGSGGPIATRHRVSSGYLLSIDGRPRILVDCGGGIFERLGSAQFDLAALDQILLTHLHVDHTSDLPAVVMHLYMKDRKQELSVTGPAGRAGNAETPENAAPQPGVSEFVRLLFGTAGAWRYMNTFEGFRISAHEVSSDASQASIQSVDFNPGLRRLGVSIKATAVPHGMMPSVAFRVEFEGHAVVFSGDVSRATSSLIELSRGCTMLVHDFALPERELPHGNLHAKPSAVGELARESGAQSLVLSHFMPPIEAELEDAVNLVRSRYSGKVEVARDLQTYEIA